MKPLAVLLVLVALPLCAEPVGTKMVRSDNGGTTSNIPMWSLKTNYIEDSGLSISLISNGTNAWVWVQANSNGVSWVFSWTNQFSGWSNAWAWVQANSNTVTTTHDSMGIWGVRLSDLAMQPLSHALTPEAGYWGVHADGAVMPTTNYWRDSLWTTNGAGAMIPRSML